MKFKKVSELRFADSRWRGICFARIGKQFRINFRGCFDYKDEMKSLCKQYGGTWDSVNRCWFIVASSEVLKAFPSILTEAVENFGEGIKTGSWVEWILPSSKSGDTRLDDYLESVFHKAEAPALNVLNGGQDSTSQACRAAGLSDSEAEEVKKAFLNKEPSISFHKRQEQFMGVSPSRTEIMCVVLDAAKYLDGQIQYDEPWEASACALGLNLLNLVDLIDGHDAKL